MSTRRKRALEEFKRTLVSFSVAADNLWRDWAALENEIGLRLSDRVIENYPFDSDYYEVVRKIAEWDRDISKLKLKSGLPQPFQRHVLDWEPED